MKTKMRILKKTKAALLFCLILFTGVLSAQTKPRLVVLDLDPKGIDQNPQTLASMARIEIAKTGKYEVMDSYDVDFMVKKKNLTISNCYGKFCLIELGKALGVDKVMSGSAELINGKINITLRIIDVKSETTEKSYSKSFLNLPNELERMIEVTINDMFGIENQPDLVSNLTIKYTLANSTNHPSEFVLNNSGVRMGFCYFTGNLNTFLKAPQSQGGYNGYPYMFQFGYQVEQQYLNESNVQALFEFIPMVTGLDQGKVIPSLTILHGLRFNRSGFEFAFGPSLNVIQTAKGYYENNEWHLESEWTDSLANPNTIISRLDSRGNYKINPGFVFALGFTIRSGNLNIPLNAYVIPNKEGMRFGASFGFNTRSKKEYKNS
ncbi:MAG: hypothetical protein V2A54_01155 [Bacteroidota bacterium]